MSRGDNQESYESLVRDLQRLESIVEGWDVEHQATVQALRSTLEAIQAGAFRSLIREVKSTQEGMDSLKLAVSDPWVFGVLDYHGILRKPQPTVAERIEKALESVRPTLAGHGGDVLFVGQPSPSEVHIRLLGSCNGCAFSDETVRLGIEQAIFEAVPEVTKVTVVSKATDLVQLGIKRDQVTGSPFESPWTDVAAFAEVPSDDVMAVELADASVLLSAVGDEIRAYPNACPHLGMPLDQGEVESGILTCRYHGFRFDLRTGECLTAPEIQLQRYPTRVDGSRVLVQVTL